MPQGSPRIQVIQTQAAKRHRSRVHGCGDTVIGGRRAKEKRWLRATLIKMHHGKCTKCREAVTLGPEGHPKQATIDHIIPLSKGGEDKITNMTLLCHSCNQAKADQVEESVPAP